MKKPPKLLITVRFSCFFGKSRLAAPPAARSQQYEDRDDLETPHDHADGEGEGGQTVEAGVAAGRTNDIEAGADVVEGGSDRAEGGEEGRGVKGGDDKQSCEDADVEEEIAADAGEEMRAQRTALEADGEAAVRRDLKT